MLIAKVSKFHRLVPSVLFRKWKTWLTLASNAELSERKSVEALEYEKRVICV